jgi:hypothetical protein
MDEKLLREIIKDYENVSKIVAIRLKQLYTLLGEAPHSTSNIGGPKNQIKETIEKQRQEMMTRVEEMRQQAMAQVQESMRQAKGMGAQGMPSMGMAGMPGMGEIPGMNRMPSTPEGIDAMKEEILERIEAEKKRAEQIKTERVNVIEVENVNAEEKEVDGDEQ